MKKSILIFCLLYSSIFTFGQSNEEINLIQIDSTWGKEIIKVPFWFAPEIDYEGYEDIRFAQGWEDIDSDGFWSLVFAWDINLKTKPTAKFFEDNLKLYFDGLMKVVNENKKLIIPKTKASFIEIKSKNGMAIFLGTVEAYDAFTTKKMIILNVTIENYFCKENNKYIPLFRFSPKDFNHKAWKMLGRAKLDANICCK